MTIPDWWGFVLLSLGAYRIWRLLAEDTILERPRRWLVRLGPNWRSEGDPVPDNYREYIALFLMCPFCLGAWVSLTVWGSWQFWPQTTTAVLVPFAISAVVGFTRVNLDPPD